MCEYSCFPRGSCIYFLPYVFNDETLYNWFYELEIQRGYDKKFDYFHYEG